jgi:hypothetical protein
LTDVPVELGDLNILGLLFTPHSSASSYVPPLETELGKSDNVCLTVQGYNHPKRSYIEWDYFAAIGGFDVK